MRETILRALVFAGTVVAVSVVVDLLLAVFYQGGTTAENEEGFLWLRAALHGATLVLSAIGAGLGFVFLRSYAIAKSRIVVLGVVLGLISLSGAILAFQAAGIWGVGAWLLFGSAAVALIGGRALGTREAHV